MKKQILGLGLAGILLGLSSNVNGLVKVDKKGFPVPYKTEAELAGMSIITGKDSSGNEVIGVSLIYYKGSNKFVYENSFNEKIESYIVFFRDDSEKEYYYMIQDKNCDGIFETKYDEFDKDAAIIPDCYLKKEEVK